MRVAGVLQTLDHHYQQWKRMNLVFGDFGRPIRRNRVNLYYWKPACGENVGDLISLVLVHRIAASLGLGLERRVTTTRRLFAIGSILDLAVPGATIWGSGLHHTVLRPHDMDLDVRAVRGPLTREALLKAGHACPATFGDPAILFPRFYQPTPKPARSFVVIPHFSKEQELLASHPHNTLSTRTADWRGFIDAIASAQLVVSGSLHGIILAEAYGVPAILLGSAMDRDEFKYEDYYHGTGRMRFDVAPTLEKALDMGGQPLPALDACREGLMKAFPRDLWES